jgi:hypothetical protein
MAEINSVEYEHRLRHRDIEGGNGPEQGVAQSPTPTFGLMPSTLRSPAVRNSVNATAYRDTMLGAQRTYGNRAVQRYRGPDEQWMWNTFSNAGSAATGLVGALPIVGNVLNAGVAGSQGINSALQYAMGNKDQAQYMAHQAQNNALNAIPLYGNVRSGAQGVHDAGAFYNNLFGGGSTPPETSGDIYHRESGPKLDDFLSSLF